MGSAPTLNTISTKQARIAALARQMPVLHNIAYNIDIDWLREAYRRTRKSGTPGVDGQTADQYAVHLEDNLHSLLDRMKSGTYRAPPVKRAHIPKGNGKTRPIGIPTFEDKVLQRAVAMALEPIYEQDFYDFSYGFRRNKSAHDALDALRDGTYWVGGGWVLDVDVQSFFDDIDRQKLRDLLAGRVADKGLVRLVGKWLRVGVLEDGVVTHRETGTPQGGVISPLLANIYLHEVLDRWWVEAVRPRLKGRGMLVRYADDFVMVFADKSDAERVHRALGQRFALYGLTLHPEKTRLVAFHRPDRGTDRPGTFTFLGFTHYWGKSRAGKWAFMKKTASSRLSRSLVGINTWLKKVRHRPLSWQSDKLGAQLRGHYNYYGIRGNSVGISAFYTWVLRLWKKWLGRRSQRRLMWSRFNRWLRTYPLPKPRIRRRSRQLRANLRW